MLFPLNNKKYIYFTSSANTQKGANEIILQKDCESSLIPFHFFHMEELLNEVFYNLLLIYISFWKLIIIFESYQNMPTFQGFCFLYHINYNFVLYVMHITLHLHVIKDFSKFSNLKNTSKYLWISNFHIFLIVSVFWIWVVGYYHVNFFTIKIILLKTYFT